MPLPNKVGVYVKQDDAYIEVAPADAQWVVGPPRVGLGALAGNRVLFGRASASARVPAGTSMVQVVVPAEFLIVFPWGASPSDYGLLRNGTNSDRLFSVEVLCRQFGDVDCSWSDMMDRPIPFDVEKVSARRFRVRLAQLEEGNYAFLSPGLLFLTDDSGPPPEDLLGARLYPFSVK